MKDECGMMNDQGGNDEHENRAVGLILDLDF
jgi:hypothetical protein